MSGPIRPPDYKVMVAVPFKGRTADFKYFHVGSAWSNEGGWFNFTIVTMPDVKFRLVPVDEK